MKHMISVLILIISSSTWADNMKNPYIDYAAFEEDVRTMKETREQKRLTEAEFIAAIESGNYVLLDARSERFYKMRHIKGAVNLPFTEFTEATLAEVIPNQSTPILIYCNNNFLNSPASFATKMPPASLNLSTQASLVSYGYTEVYELGPLLDVNNTKISFSGTEVQNQ